MKTLTWKEFWKIQGEGQAYAALYVGRELVYLPEVCFLGFWLKNDWVYHEIPASWQFTDIERAKFI